MKPLTTLAALCATVGLLALAPAGIAQVGDPTVDVYGGAPGGTQTQVGGVNANTPAAPTSAARAERGAVGGVSAQGGGPSVPGAGGAGAQTAGSPVEAAGNSLAFTGLDVGLVLGAGVLLLLVGTTVRWVTRRADTAAP